MAEARDALAPTTPRLSREYRTIARMVDIHCAAHHSAGATPCATCAGFLDYAAERLAKCPYGEAKPTCAKCPVHCYRHEKREFARETMRYAGPRMLTRHPVLAVRHLLDGRREAPPPLEFRRAARKSPPPR